MTVGGGCHLPPWRFKKHFFIDTLMYNTYHVSTIMHDNRTNQSQHLLKMTNDESDGYD